MYIRTVFLITYNFIALSVV